MASTYSMRIPGRSYRIDVLEEANREGVSPETITARYGAAVPSRQGLLPHEILALCKAGKYHVQTEGPADVRSYLMEQGFLEPGTIQETLEALKVTDLKAELRDRGMKVSGKKAELVDRLLEGADHGELEAKYPERYYRLTQKGQQELAENEYIPYLDKTGYMSIWEMNQELFRNNPDGFDYRDIVWRALNKRSAEAALHGDVALYIETRTDMHFFLVEEGKFGQALSVLCGAAAVELSGMAGIDWYCNLETDRYALETILEYGFPYRESNYVLPISMAVWMGDLREALDLNDEAFRAALINGFERNSIPPRWARIFTNEECADIVINEIGQHPRKLATIYKHAEERLRERLRAMETE